MGGIGLDQTGFARVAEPDGAIGAACEDLMRSLDQQTHTQIGVGLPALGRMARGYLHIGRRQR